MYLLHAATIEKQLFFERENKLARQRFPEGNINLFVRSSFAVFQEHK